MLSSLVARAGFCHLFPDIPGDIQGELSRHIKEAHWSPDEEVMFKSKWAVRVDFLEWATNEVDTQGLEHIEVVGEMISGR